MRRRQRRSLLQRGREQGRLLLAMLRPPVLSRTTLLALRAVTVLRPHPAELRRADLQPHPVEPLCAALHSAPTPGAATLGPHKLMVNTGETKPQADKRALAMPFKDFFIVLAAVRRHLPHRITAPPILPLPDQPAVVLSPSGKLTYGQVHASLLRVRTYRQEHGTPRLFDVARLLHISLDLATKVVAAGNKIKFFDDAEHNNFFNYVHTAPD